MVNSDDDDHDDDDTDDDGDDDDDVVFVLFVFVGLHQASELRDICGISRGFGGSQYFFLDPRNSKGGARDPIHHMQRQVDSGTSIQRVEGGRGPQNRGRMSCVGGINFGWQVWISGHSLCPLSTSLCGFVHGRGNELGLGLGLGLRCYNTGW